jgi:Sulfotransferase family
MELSDSGAPNLVFVGGTGRSGTHILAELLGRHPHYHDVPIECRFHTNPQGFPDLLAGRATKEEFLRKLRRFWWYRIKAGEFMPALLPKLPMGREVRGLHKIMPRERFDAAVERFDLAYEADPVAACRQLFLDLLGPEADAAGRPGLVEMSSDSVAEGPTLLRVFPEAKLIHTVRDGRDAGASKVSLRQKPEHPHDGAEGVGWWEQRVRRIDQAVRQVPPGKVLLVGLDELVHDDREAGYRSILDFLEIEDAPPMREFFETEMSAAEAHRGRWREGLPEAEQELVRQRYEEALDSLEADGVHAATLLRRVYERDGA